MSLSLTFEVELPAITRAVKPAVRYEDDLAPLRDRAGSWALVWSITGDGVAADKRGGKAAAKAQAIRKRMRTVCASEQWETRSTMLPENMRPADGIGYGVWVRYVGPVSNGAAMPVQDKVVSIQQVA